MTTGGPDQSAQSARPVGVKICGIRSLEAGLAAVEGGADYLGFVFYRPVRRFIDPTTARGIIHSLRQHGSKALMIGLFVNETPATMALIANQVGLDGLQLAGHEPPELLFSLAELGRPVLKTIHLTTAAEADGTGDVTLLRDRLDRYLIAAAELPAWPHGQRVTFLCDAAVPGQYGGTGQRADWGLAANLTQQYPCGLAGGLTIDNVAAAIAQVQPWLVDVSGGVETDGVKDPAKIRAFLSAARGQTTTGPMSSPATEASLLKSQGETTRPTRGEA